MTLKELLAQSVVKRPENVALRYKRNGSWASLSYRALLTQVHTAAEFLASLGVKAGDRVGLYRENSPEWPVVYFAITGLGAIAVPIDTRLREQEVAHILRDAATKVVISGAKNYPLLCDIEQGLACLQHVVLIDGKNILPVDRRRIHYHDYAEGLASVEKKALTAGRAYDKHNPVDDDIASLIYTSGTTGRQKGAMLTHGNFASNVESAQKAIEIKLSDNFLLVLPLHHAFAFTTNMLLPIAVGAEISLVENLKTVGDNMREVSPSLLIGVPLLLEKMYNRIWNGLKENKPAYLMYRLGIKKPVLRGIANKLGGRLRLIVSGGAPCDTLLLEGYGKLGLTIVEGYGLTEAAPVVTFNPPNATKIGSVGKPLPGVEVKIDDPNAEGIGEIVTRGPNLMKGYYNNPEATAESLRDGWLFTGDMGHIDSEGYVFITGRKKSLIVNREGKNIYPEEVEQQMVKSPFISEALVVGYRETAGKVGEQVGVIVVPNQEAIDAQAMHEKKAMGEKEINDLVRSEVRRVAAAIAEYKRPRRIQIRWEEFDKTSTGKIKRFLYAMTSDEE